MIVTKKYLSRRTMLRGAGAAVALPLLDGMVPAFAAIRNSAAKPQARFMAVYAGNGMTMNQWTPKQDGALELTPILQSLDGVKDDTLVLSGLNSLPVDAVQDGGIHPRCQTAWFTATTAKKSDEDLYAGTSVDQHVAAAIGTDTQFSSLEFSMEPTEGLVGNCAFGYGCAYNNTISWINPTTPLPMEPNPRMMFERLFGASGTTDKTVRLAQIQKNRSILDSLMETVTELQPRISPDDRRKLEQYLDAVRDVERRIVLAEQQVGRELPVIESPVGIPASFEEHAKLQFDLAALAFQTDLTRVATVMIARELSNRSYPEIGVPDSHHPLSHHGNNAEKMGRLAKLNTFHLRMFGHFVDKLAATPDGDGTLLDHSINLYGSGIGDSNSHNPHNLPVVIVGGKSMGIQGGRHVTHPTDTPLSNLFLTLMDRIGVPNIESFGDSSGRLNMVSGV